MKRQKSPILQVISLVIIIFIFAGIRYVYIKYISRDNAIKTTTSKSSDSDTIKYSKIPITVTMDAEAESIDENNTKFKITTNLPDNTNLMITVSSLSEEFNYEADCKGNVNNGMVETESFTSNNRSLPNGNYQIKVTTPIEMVQDYDSVRELLGKNGCNLDGDYIQDNDNSGKTVEFTKNIVINDSLTSKFDAEPAPKIGMKKDELLRCNWGKPENINRTTTANGTEEQWCYSGYRYIYVDNGVVTTIQGH